MLVRKFAPCGRSAKVFDDLRPAASGRCDIISRHPRIRHYMGCRSERAWPHVRRSRSLTGQKTHCVGRRLIKFALPFAERARGGPRTNHRNSFCRASVARNAPGRKSRARSQSRCTRTRHRRHGRGPFAAITAYAGSAPAPRGRASSMALDFLAATIRAVSGFAPSTGRNALGRRFTGPGDHDAALQPSHNGVGGGSITRGTDVLEIQRRRRLRPHTSVAGSGARFGIHADRAARPFQLSRWEKTATEGATIFRPFCAITYPESNPVSPGPAPCRRRQLRKRFRARLDGGAGRGAGTGSCEGRRVRAGFIWTMTFEETLHR